MTIPGGYQARPDSASSVSRMLALPENTFSRSNLFPNSAYARTSTMPKRKRDSTDEAGGRLHKSLQVQQKRVEEKLFHSKKVLQRALKVAKGFERQKLGRRQKTAVQQKNEADKIRIDEEIEALKVSLYFEWLKLLLMLIKHFFGLIEP